MLRSLKDDVHAIIDIGIVLMVGLVFIALVVFGFIIFAIRDALLPDGPWRHSTTFRGFTDEQNATYNRTYNALTNVSSGFDSSVNLLIVAITIFILALAITALLMLRRSN